MWLLPGRRSVPIEGRIHPGFHAVAEALRQQLNEYPGGGAVCVYHRGECVVDIWGGVSDDSGTPWAEDTMAPSFSTTKGVAATLTHILVDRGLLDYDDRVGDYWPEFAQAGKARITVRHVLSHQSGLYHIRQMIDDAQRMLDWDYMVHAIERAHPQHAPGERTGYHGLTFGFLVGEILQRITHKSFAQMVHDEIAAPLELDGMYVGAPLEAVPRAAQLMWPSRGVINLTTPFEGDSRLGMMLMRGGATALEWLLRIPGLQVDFESILDALAPRGISTFDFGAAETLQVSIPAANGLFTARSLARMYAALAGGGEIDGVRLLSERTLQRATRVQPRPAGLKVMPYDMRWRLGYHGVLTSRGVPRRAFGHFGFGGSGAWADPSRDLAVGLIVNSGMGTPFGDLRIVRIGGAALQCAQAWPRTSSIRRRKTVPTPPRASRTSKVVGLRSRTGATAVASSSPNSQV